MLNDMMQSLLPAIYPILKDNHGLTFGQIGFLTFTFQVTASLLQPLIGFFTDKHPQPYSLSIGMAFSFAGLLLLSMAGSYSLLLAAAALVGTGSGLASGVLARRAWQPATGPASRNRYFRWAAISARRSGRCSPRSSFCATGRGASPGSRSRPSSA
jgi:MFS family permease